MELTEFFKYCEGIVLYLALAGNGKPEMRCVDRTQPRGVKSKKASGTHRYQRVKEGARREQSRFRDRNGMLEGEHWLEAVLRVLPCIVDCTSISRQRMGD